MKFHEDHYVPKIFHLGLIDREIFEKKTRLKRGKKAKISIFTYLNGILG